MFHVFPHGLDATLLVPVLIGVLVNAAFTETLGWDFVGLVVPGYLCSVVMLQPIVAAVVLAEAIATWAIARVIDAIGTRGGVIYPVFGRDRFYLILVVSVIVRAGVEGLAMQPALSLLRPAWPSLSNYEPDLFGIGLVLVPLMANRFWRPGLPSGLWQLGIETVVVRLVVLGLQHFTNFSVAGFALSFDRLALGFLDAPGGQLVLVCTAALASHFNRRFGWDGHGILVPALLGLVVLAPLKLAATMVEVMVIVAMVSLIVRLPRVRHLNLEGPRKIVLCFSVGFGVRALFLAVLGARYPGYRAADLFGFGYLLPSLLAERVIAKGHPTMVVLATVQTALVGLPLAGGLALALDWAAPGEPARGDGDSAERYVTLAQAVASYTQAEPPATPEALARTIERLMRGHSDAVSADGYALARSAGAGYLLARRTDTTGVAATVLVVEPTLELPEQAAAEAARTGAALVVGPDGPARASIARRLGRTTVTFAAAAGDGGATRAATAPLATRLLVLPSPQAPALPGPAVVIQRRALLEAAFRLARDHDDPDRLATSLRALGLSIELSAEGRVVASGAGWPLVVLRPSAAKAPIVVAPHGRELGAGAVALFAADVLGGDCVIADAVAGAGTDQAPTTLALELAVASSRPLLIIRGTDEPDDMMNGDTLLFASPEGASPQATSHVRQWPRWMDELAQATAGWLVPANPPPPVAAAYRRFPAGTSRLTDAALLWLSLRARRALGGDSALARDDFAALAAKDGLPLIHGDIADWLLSGKGAPPAAAIDAAEQLARTEDPAMLAPSRDGAQAAMVIDAARGLIGIGVTKDDHRAVIIAGDRREGRTSVHSRGEVLRALSHGARTLVGS